MSHFSAVDFFNRINLMYGTVSDVCTKESCPTMSGGSKYEYLWQDGAEYKKPTRLSAPDYMVLLMDWIELRINDEAIFPTSTNVPFPKDFPSSLQEDTHASLPRFSFHGYTPSITLRPRFSPNDWCGAAR
ncbi:Mob1/phocein family protein [Cooperia oncophora]